jgi:hypothetical protein
MRNSTSQSGEGHGRRGFVPLKRMVIAGILAAVCGILIANIVPSSVSAPGAGVPVLEATVSPLAIMTQAPRDLPAEQYDAH